MKLLTKDTDYAVRALLHMAKQGNGAYQVRKLADDLGIPMPFLRKILQQLASAGVLDSVRGKGGGFSLARRPEDIFLLDIMEIFQGKFEIMECIFNRNICPNLKQCTLRKKLISIKDYVQEQLESITLKELLEEK
ncbi:MAG: Rrf2 family transcriptional regulator [Actinomycetota bacterium]|nr:Rrf2 family transcriptional regulator [Actinomycetota bacterium]